MSDVISCDGAATADNDDNDDSRQINAHFKDTHFSPKAVILIKHTPSNFYRCTVHSKIYVVHTPTAALFETLYYPTVAQMYNS